MPPDACLAAEDRWGVAAAAPVICSLIVWPLYHNTLQILQKYKAEFSAANFYDCAQALLLAPTRAF